MKGTKRIVLVRKKKIIYIHKIRKGIYRYTYTRTMTCAQTHTHRRDRFIIVDGGKPFPKNFHCIRTPILHRDESKEGKC